MLREWRKGVGGKEDYKEGKRKYNRICEEKKERMKEQKIKEAGETRTEGKVWEIIGREKGGKKRVEEVIREEEWRIIL